MPDPDFTDQHRDPGESAGDGVNVGGGALSAIGEPLAGTDAKPDDLFPDLQRSFAPRDADAQGGANEQRDALRAHADAQGTDQPSLRGLDETRAHQDDAASDNGAL